MVTNRPCHPWRTTRRSWKVFKLLTVNIWIIHWFSQKKAGFGLLSWQYRSMQHDAGQKTFGRFQNCIFGNRHISCFQEIPLRFLQYGDRWAHATSCVTLILLVPSCSLHFRPSSQVISMYWRKTQGLWNRVLCLLSSCTCKVTADIALNKSIAWHHHLHLLRLEVVEFSPDGGLHEKCLASSYFSLNIFAVSFSLCPLGWALSTACLLRDHSPTLQTPANLITNRTTLR